MSLKNRLFASYLDDGEKIVYVAHRHILIFKIDAAKTAFFGIVLPVLFFLLFPKLLLVFLIWLFVGIFGLFYHFIDWYYDIKTNAGNKLETEQKFKNIWFKIRNPYLKSFGGIKDDRYNYEVNQL